MVKAKPKDPKRFKYEPQQLKLAVAELIQSGQSSRWISKKYNIPRSTLMSKVKDTSPEIKKGGPPTILTNDEEQHLVSWMMLMSTNGFPVSKTQLLGSVQILMKTLNREHPFRNGIPGRSWITAFLNRHPEVTERIAQNLTISRASISESSIRSWFLKVEKELTEKFLINIDGSRVFNGDESSFLLAPKGEEVFVKKREKSLCNIIRNDDKECLTTLFVANAKGNLAPPLVVFSYKRIPNCIRKNIPEGWAIGKSDNGWMNGENFYEYIVNIFHPWLIENEIKFPIVLYIDGHSSHLTMAVSDFCREKQIVLIALHPNATHILQPLDVSFIHPLKLAWRKVVGDWRIKHNGDKLPKENFAYMLKEAVDTLNIESIISNGFKTTGLHPLSANSIDYQKLRKKPTESKKLNCTKSPDNISDILTTAEKFIDPTTLVKFKETGIDGEWNGRLEDFSLFYFWKNLQNQFNNEAIECTSVNENYPINYLHGYVNDNHHSEAPLHQFLEQNVDDNCRNAVTNRQDFETSTISSVSDKNEISGDVFILKANDDMENVLAKEIIGTMELEKCEAETYEESNQSCV